MTEEAVTRPEREQLERALVEQRAVTEARIAALRTSLEDVIASSEGSPPDDEHDPDGATSGFERAQIAALLDKFEEDMAELDGALDRLAGDAYGVCIRCGSKIAFERLLARPATRVCIACASA